MSKAIAVERQSTGSADADGHPSTPRSTNPKSPKNPTDVPRQSKLLPTRRPPLMIKPHGRLVSSRLTRQSHPDCRATGCDPHNHATWTKPVIRLSGYKDAPFLKAERTPVLHAAF